MPHEATPVTHHEVSGLQGWDITKTTMTKKELKARLATLKETLAKPTMTNATAKEVLENNIKKLTEQINEQPDDEPEVPEKLEERVENLEEKAKDVVGKIPTTGKAKYHKGQTFKGYWTDGNEKNQYDEIEVLKVFPPGNSNAPADGKAYGYDVRTNAGGHDNISEATLGVWLKSLSKTKPAGAKSQPAKATGKHTKLVEDPNKGGKYKIIGKDGKEITSSNEEFCHALLKREKEKRDARKKSGNKSRERSPLLKAEDQVADAMENIVDSVKDKTPSKAGDHIVSDVLKFVKKALADTSKYPEEKRKAVAEALETIEEILKEYK